MNAAVSTHAASRWTQRALPVTVGLLAAAWVLLESPFSPLPGREASALTGFAGLQPFRTIGTPLWGALVWALSHLPIPLSTSIILSQAVMAGLTTGILAAILMRLPFRRGWDATPELCRAEWRDRMLAAFFGAVFFAASSSYLLTFAYPRPEALSLTLLLGALAFSVEHFARGGAGRLAGAMALFSLSAADHVAAVLIAPLVLLAAIARTAMRRESIVNLLLPAIAAGLAGALAIAAGIYLFMDSPAARWRELAHVGEAVRLFWQDYMARGPRAIPRVGWLAILMLAFIPLPFMLVRQSGGNSRIAGGFSGAALRLLALPVVAMVILFELPGAPLRVTNAQSPLPLIYAAAALWTGRLFGYVVGLIVDGRPPKNARGASFLPPPPRWRRAAGWIWIALGLAVAGWAAVRNHPVDAAQIARGAAAMAGHVAQAAGTGGWILTGGELDDHLLLSARDRGTSARVLNLRAVSRKPYQRFLAERDAWFDPEWIGAAGFEAVFAQWLVRSAEAGAPVFALSALDVFAPPGWAMRPAPSAYALTRADAPPDTNVLADCSRLLEHTAPLAARGTARNPVGAGFAAWFNSFMARYANETAVDWSRAGQPDRAQAALARALAFDASNPAPHINRLILLRAAGVAPDDASLEAARVALEPITGTHRGPGFQMAFGRIATVGSPESSTAAGEIPGATSQPALIDRYLYLAAEGRDAEAQAELDALLTADPKLLPALRERFALRIKRRDFTGARTDLAAIQELGVSAWIIQLAEGRLLMEENRHEEAVAHFQALTLRHNALPDAYLGLAQALERAGRRDDWRRVLPDLNRVAGQHPPALIYLAEKAADNRDPVLARRYWERALELDPGSLATLETLLRLDFAERNAEKLAKHAATLLRRQPHNGLAWYALATGSALGEDWAQAVRAYEVAARRAPNLEVLHDWGWALNKLDRKDEALEKIDAALKLQPDSARAWATRGLIELEAGRPAGAVTNLTRAITLGSRGRDMLESLERALLANGETEKAARVRQELQATATP